MGSCDYVACNEPAKYVLIWYYRDSHNKINGRIDERAFSCGEHLVEVAKQCCGKQHVDVVAGCGCPDTRFADTSGLAGTVNHALDSSEFIEKVKSLFRKKEYES